VGSIGTLETPTAPSRKRIWERAPRRRREEAGVFAMKFETPLIPAILIRRYKRFLADVRLDDGPEMTVHCPNSGSMLSCVGEGWPVRLSESSNPKRKYRHTWELVHNGRCWIGINTHLANTVAADGIVDGTVAELGGYLALKREVPYGDHSRVDILLSDESRRCYVEVKNVTLVDDRGRYAFPDAVTERGRKHLRELAAMVASGDRAAMLFVVQRGDGSHFVPADAIDPEYGEALRRAAAAGVEVLAYRADVRPESIELAERVDVIL
jgi:sugar fermentation stimulation protein A